MAKIDAWRYIIGTRVRACELSKCRPRRNPIVFSRRGGWVGVLSVSWTFSDRRSNIADVIQQGLQDTREHARGSEVSRGRRVEVGRCGARGINFQYERYAAGRTASVQLSGILFEALSPRISDREVSAPGVDTSQTNCPWTSP